MPWWANTYLIAFVLLTILGIEGDLKRPNRAFYIGGEIVTAAFVIIFVYGYFYPKIGSQLGFYAFPMLAIGVAHELFAAKRTMDEESEDPELSENELFYLNNIGLLLANLFIVPGYVFGFMVGMRNVGL